MTLRSNCRATGIFALLAALPAAFAQTVPPANVAPADDTVLKLDEFTVSADKSQGYRATNSITATGIGAKISDTPLAINVVTSEFINDRSMFDVYETLNTVPGVLTNPRSESAFTVRGFGGNITYRNGQYRRQLLTDWNIDQVEVILGPSAIFFGAVRPGGIVNYITKKPVFSGNFADVKITAGSDGLYRGEVFQNLKVNDKLAIRLGMGLLDDSNKNLDRFYKHESYFGGSAIWKPTASQQLTVDLEGISRKQFYLNVYGGRILTNSHYFGNAAAIAAENKTKPASTDTTTWLAANGYSSSVGVYDMFAPVYGSHGNGYGYALASDGRSYNESQTVDLDYLLKITDSLVFESTFNYAVDDASGLQLADADTRVYADGTMRLRFEDWINVRHSQMLHNKFTYRVNFLKMKHTMQLGQDYQYVRYARPGYVNAANQWNDSVGNNGSSPYYLFNPAAGPISLEAMRKASGQEFNGQRDRWEQNYGFFFVDQITMFDDRLFLLAGARQNRFTGRIKYNRPVVISNLLVKKDANGLADYDLVGSKGKTTPQAGALVKVTKGLSAYATWSTSIEPNFSIDADGNTSEPVESKSWDFGVKADLLDNRLSATVAYYDIKRENLAYTDTAKQNATGKSPYSIFGNSEASKGGELNVNYSPVDFYQMVFGWSHVIDAQTTKSNNAALVGRRFGYIPENTYTMWNRFAFTGAAKGLIAGFGIRHNDSAMASQSLDTAVNIPAFTVYDAMLSYRFKAANRDWNAQLNVKNLTSTVYRDNADGFIAEPRRFYLSLGTRF
jgi:iron complex outermembrane receptor protein